MQPGDRLVALQRAAQHAVVFRDLRVAGAAGSIFGVLALLASVGGPTLDYVLLTVGGVVAVAGLWNLTNPHPIGILFLGVSLVLVGGTNLIGGFVEAASGGRPSVFWQVLGFWQIVWGVQCVPRYGRFKGGFDVATTSAERKDAWSLIKDVRRMSSRKRPDTMTLEVPGFLPKPAWLRLMPDGALCLIGASEDVRAVPREQLSLDVMQEVRFGRAYKVRMRLADRILVAVLRKDQYEKYQAWKQTTAVTEARAA